MPANALVNLAYLLVAAYWARALSRLTPDDPRWPGRRWFAAMALLGGVYGPIQFMRTVTQARGWAVLDQWVTLPFFALVIAWNVALRDAPGARTAARNGAILAVSIASYGLVLVSPEGFVIALAAHLALAIGTSIVTLREGRFTNVAAFAGAFACCAAFVVLKEADFALARSSVLFTRLTGHFWSKLGDAGQLHFALCFFAGAYRARAIPSSAVAVAA